MNTTDPIRETDETAERRDGIARMLQSEVRAAEKDRDEFVEQITQSCYATTYALGWADGLAVNAATAALCERVLVMDDTSDADLLTVLRHVVTTEARNLITNRYRSGSSSGFDRANEAAQREAAARFVRLYAGEVGLGEIAEMV